MNNLEHVLSNTWNIPQTNPINHYAELGRPYKVWTFAPGEEIPDFQPFDIMLTRSLESWMGKTIALVDGGFYTHAAKGYRSPGFLAESLEWGVEVEHINKYKNHFYAIIRLTDLSQEEKDAMQAFMDTTLWANRNRYGYMIILSILLSNLSRSTIQFGDNTGSKICSGFCCMTLKSGVKKIQFPKTPSFMTPNGMAEYFGVPQPSKEMQRYHKLGYVDSHIHLGGVQPV